jgi:hypothetical protein
MMEPTYISRDVDDDIGAPDRHRLTVRQALGSIRTNMIRWRSCCHSFGRREGNAMVVNKLQAVNAPIWREGIEDFEREAGVRVEQTVILGIERPQPRDADVV